VLPGSRYFAQKHVAQSVRRNNPRRESNLGYHADREQLKSTMREYLLLRPI
jgi:hypothetical protein